MVIALVMIHVYTSIICTGRYSSSPTLRSPIMISAYESLHPFSDTTFFHHFLFSFTPSNQQPIQSHSRVFKPFQFGNTCQTQEDSVRLEVNTVQSLLIAQNTLQRRINTVHGHDPFNLVSHPISRPVPLSTTHITTRSVIQGVPWAVHQNRTESPPLLDTSNTISFQDMVQIRPGTLVSFHDLLTGSTTDVQTVFKQQFPCPLPGTPFPWLLVVEPRETVYVLEQTPQDFQSIPHLSLCLGKYHNNGEAITITIMDVGTDFNQVVDDFQ